MMIQTVGRYELITTDFDALDELSDQIMDALVLMEDVRDPDVAVSIPERLLEVSVVVVDATGPLDGMERAVHALRVAFESAGEKLPESQIFMHESLIGSAVAIHAEPVPA